MELKRTERLEKSVAELTIEVSAEELNKARDRAYKKNGRSIQVPGFRKGKAPRVLIEKMFGDVFFEDALNLILPDLIEQAVEEAGVIRVGRASVELGDEDVPEGGAVVIAKVPVEPDVTLSDYKGLTAEKVTVSVTEEETEQELARMAKRMSRIETVDREARIGDIVNIDFDGSVDGVPFEGGAAENQDLELGSGVFIPGFEDQLVGCRAGEQRAVAVTFPEEYHAEELKGKDAVFQCTVHEVKEAVLPELDDEFAKDVSETAETMEDLRKEVSDRLLKAKNDTSDREFEEKLMDQVLEGMQADIPDAMFDSEAATLMNDFAYRIQMQGVSIEQYVRSNGMDMESFKDAFRPQAERQVKVRLALKRIADLENIEISDEDVNAEYERLCELYGMEGEQIRSVVNEENVRSDLRLNRAIAVVKDNAVIQEISGEKNPDSAE